MKAIVWSLFGLTTALFYLQLQGLALAAAVSVFLIVWLDLREHALEPGAAGAPAAEPAGGDGD